MTSVETFLKRRTIKDLFRSDCLVTGASLGTIRLMAETDSDSFGESLKQDYLRRPYAVLKGEEVLFRGDLREAQAYLTPLYISDRLYYSTAGRNDSVCVGEFLRSITRSRP